MNIDPIKISGNFDSQSDEYDELIDSIRSKRKKKEMSEINYSGQNLNNSLNNLNNLGPYQIPTTQNISNNTPSTPLDTFNKMISKNAEKRFSKNHNFIFGNYY
jgi:hypothetical protein